jgi:hypothetical protein
MVTENNGEETMEQYLTRIGAKNNKTKTEEFARFDNDNEWT